jgi:general secretion pathway protein G
LARQSSGKQICKSANKMVSGNFSKWKIQSAFTLIELLVVISIIGILATLISANLNSARVRARDAQRKGDLKQISIALRTYYNDNGAYPASNASGQIVGCKPAATLTSCSWGSTWSVGTTVYMKPLPMDPVSSQSYSYLQTSSGDGFTLSGCLENGSDAQGTAVPTPNPFSSGCSSSGSIMFQITQ